MMTMKVHKMKHVWLALAVSMLIVAGCKKDDDNGDSSTTPPVATFEMQVNLKVGTQPFVRNQGMTFSDGSAIRVENLRFYFSDVRLVREDGTEVMVNDVAYFTAGDGLDEEAQLMLTGYPEQSGNYKAVKLGVGLPADLNASDPSSFDSNDHPLHTFRNMHWGWAAKYKFIEMDARMDTLGNGTFDHSVVYHVGHDDFYDNSKTIDCEFELNTGESFKLFTSIDLEAIFINGTDPIDYRQDDLTHTTNSGYNLAERYYTNFVSAIQ